MQMANLINKLARDMTKEFLKDKTFDLFSLKSEFKNDNTTNETVQTETLPNESIIEDDRIFYIAADIAHKLRYDAPQLSISQNELKSQGISVFQMTLKSR